MSRSAYDDVDVNKIARDAMCRYGFDPDFSALVKQQVKAVREDLQDAAGVDGVRDLRGLLWSSIDNADSLDLDQIEYCERGPRQEILIKVAIADVDLFVPKGSPVDQRAANNGTSVYTGVETFPMLPDRLSTDISSLCPGGERMAVVIEFAVLSNGSIRQGDIYRAMVINKVKLVYEEVGAWLEARGPAPEAFAHIPGLEEQVRLQDEAAERLKTFRMDQGALDLESLETKAIKEDGVVVALVLPQENRAQYVIENFMIAANRTVMDRLSKAGVMVIQRVVRIPKDWPGIMKVAAEFHEALPLEPSAKALSVFLLKRKAADPLRFPDLSLTIVKLMGPGEYEMLEPGKPPIGHFGLAISDYTHATAPNRRYVDVIIQRLIKAVIFGRSCPYTRKELVEHAAWCTDRDKASKKVERFMRKVEAALILRGRVGEEFEGIVTGASEKGTYVRLTEPPVEGRVVQSGVRMSVGQKVNVRLTDINPYEGHIDLVPVGAVRSGFPRPPVRKTRRPRYS
ncbi:MAG: RNB domain-containing ribonuclease [Candidatus Omnitrophica bacterium]|nr:RNB domain-containing ribonuclease [Candidatus Omnitrophota bacterium]